MSSMGNEYSIVDWDSITSNFKSIFDCLGDIDHSDNYIRFTSFKSDVKTGISINRNGEFDASMPLHGIGGKVERIIFTENIVQLIGQSLDYTYRIPPEILNRRK